MFGCRRYNGTRTDLENEFVKVSLNEDSALMLGRRPLVANVPFQGVLDYGFLSVLLSKQGRNSVTMNLILCNQ